MGLSPAQLTRLSALLDQALPLAPAARRAWLEALPAADQPLLQNLRGVLLADDPAAALDQSLQHLPRITPTDPANAADSDRRPGERVGAYELLRLLGAGGMAEVWLARRADGAFEREVALKIPHLEPVRAEMAARFTQECNILAALESPGIARLYDAGIDASGVPYFAMEYVRGEALTSWCDQRGLGFVERLHIFQQVLQAVGHAHARNVIHRDLKPSNILVTGQGEVRLLDFGVARLLQEETAERRSLTHSFGRAMTPEYASPELLRGQPIDVRSDIYSLGVVLHELLTGVRPGQSRPDSAQRTVLPAGMREVLARAMETAPADRHADVAQFAADLRRFESGRRSAARATGTLPRYAVLGALAVVAALLVLLWQRDMPGNTGTPGLDPANIVFMPSIAVLPFTDLSEARDQAYLSDGLAEELLNLLTRIPGLRVTARASSFAFRGAPAETAVIAKKLNVDHILEGSVRRAGNRLRFSVQLVQAATGTVLWSEKYDRDLTDIFDVQEDVANAVVDALKVRLLARQGVPSGERTQNTHAYEEYLLGLQFRDGFSLERQHLARAAFERAVQQDPRFAAAHAGLALTASLLGDMTMQSEYLDVAWQEAELAIALAPNLAVAYVARARVRRARSWDFPGARRDLETARAIEPNNAEVMQAWGGYLAATGSFTEAVEIQRQGVERNPMASAAWEWLGAALLGARDFKGAGNAFARAGELSPYSDYRLQLNTLIALYAGNHVEALRLANLNKDPDQRDFCLALAEHAVGNVMEARQALQRLIERAPDLLAAQISRAYAWFGDWDQAFHWLNRAIDLHDPGIAGILSIPEYDGLRKDPRYQRALYRMNLGRD
jgi:serine/threonine protein kinase/Tfp pilus assembly protein PilF